MEIRSDAFLSGLSGEVAPDASLFASRDATGKHLVLIALNLSADVPMDASIALEGCAPVVSQRHFSYQQASKAIEPGSATPDPDVRARLPPYSINVFDLTLR
jgi:hypothetical protein